jgi:hypothetical protein
MNKTARKPSSDPIQEKLRQSKSQWNKDVSTFITDLINLKKTMNGWPSKFHMERSFIKDPIPSDPHSILGVLASDFQELAQSGNSIIQQQIEYSKARKKKQPKTTNVSTPSISTSPASNLTQQLSASLDYNLTVEGSNSVTRFFSRLKGPWFGSSPEVRARKYRLAMLRATALLEKDLEKFEIQILGSSGESIFVASKLLFQIDNHLKFVLESLNALKSLENESVSSAQPMEENIPVASSEVDRATAAITDFRKNFANFDDLDGTLVKQFSSLILKFLSDDSVKEALAPEINRSYQLLLTDINNKRGTSAATLSEVLMKTKSAMQVVAQNLLDKWVGKLNHKLNPFDKTSAIRLDISKLAKESRTILNQLMNSLEKGLNPEDVKSSLSEINNKMIMIKSLMRPLEATIKGKLFDKTFVDLLGDNKLTDYESKLDKKQKEQLEKMIQTKQFRDLTNMYSRK